MMKAILIILAVLGALYVSKSVLNGIRTDAVRKKAKLDRIDVNTEIRIAGDSVAAVRMLARTIRKSGNTGVLEKCSFFSGKAEDLLGKLREGTADIVILSGEGADITDPNLKTKQFVMDENEEYGLLVWNDLKHSSDRDRVLFIIENENYHLKRGYCEFAE